MDNHAGNIPEQPNIPPMVLIQWPQQVHLPFNPHVSVFCAALHGKQ